MTPQERAKELVDKMTENFPFDYDIARWQAKQCALICVDEMMEYAKALDSQVLERLWSDEPDYQSHESFLQSVKQEIEKL